MKTLIKSDICTSQQLLLLPLLIILLPALLISISAADAYADLKSDITGGENLLKAGKNEDAYQAFMALFRGNPDNETVNYALARAALSAGHPNQAIIAFDLLLAKHPDSALYRNGISKAYLAVGDEKTARYYLERLPAAKPKPAAKRFDFNGVLRFGGIYDTNANQGPESNYLKLGDYWVTLDNAKSVQSYAAYFGGNLDASYRLSATGPWRAVGDIGLNARYNFNEDLKEGDREFSGWYRGALGLRGIFSSRLLDIRAKSEIFDYDFYQTVYSYGGELTFIQALKQKFHLITSLSGDYREYVRNVDYSGVYAYAGEYLRVFFGSSFNSVTVGGRYILGSAERESLSYNGWEASLSGRFNLPRGFIISSKGSYGEEYYDGAATVLDRDDRRDSRITGGVAVSYSVSKSFSAEIGYQYMKSVSNSELYDYERHTVNAGGEFRFP